MVPSTLIDPDRTLADVKVGDRVRRMISGVVPMDLLVAGLDDQFIYCATPSPTFETGEPGPDWQGWKFDRKVGYEVDEDLGWGVQRDGSVMTGSFLVGIIAE